VSFQGEAKNPGAMHIAANARKDIPEVCSAQIEHIFQRLSQYPSMIFSARVFRRTIKKFGDGVLGIVRP